MVAGVPRRSNGLREFMAHIHGQGGLRVLDLGPASQASVQFITGMGHRVYNEDLYPELIAERYWVKAEKGTRRWDANLFLGENLNYLPAIFDAILCWDVLDMVPDPAAAPALVARLGDIAKAGAALLLFFHTAEPGAPIAVMRSQIKDYETLEMYQRGQFALQRPLNNRNIEALFKQFRALKFFLSRDATREVVAVR
jgi:hypothetical protein